jgi:hypothetical protein
MMIKGIRIRMKEGMRTTLPVVRLVRFPLFCLVVVLSTRLAFSEAAQPVPTNLNAALNYAASDRGAGSMGTPERRGNNGLSSVVQTSKNNRDRQVYELTPIPNPSIGVEIIGGLALFFWVQRFRNSSV